MVSHPRSRCEYEAHWVASRRDRNEWINAASTRFGTERLTVVCECGDCWCARTINLTKSEYERVRAHATHFVIVVNHENPESDMVVSEGERYAVVRTIEPNAMRISRETDGRSLSASTSSPPGEAG